MIIDGFLTVAYSIFGLILERLPEADPTLLSYITSQVAGLKSALNTINWFFPINQLYIVLGFVFTIELLGLGTKVFFWITENLSLGIFKPPR